MLSHLRPAIVIFTALTAICGIAYPLLVTGIGQAAFADQASGSLVVRGGHVIGSRLIGQSFTAPRYFWGRPSATAPAPNNAAGSSGANQGPSNPALKEAVAGRIAALRAADPNNRDAIPVDLVTASASGLDPHISPAYARLQVARVAKERGLPTEVVAQLVEDHVEGRLLGFIGEPRVNVVELNIALEGLTP